MLFNGILSLIGWNVWAVHPTVYEVFQFEVADSQVSAPPKCLPKCFLRHILLVAGLIVGRHAFTIPSVGSSTE